MLSSGAVASVAALASPRPVLAAVDVNDLSRLKAGREQVQYLLDNWDTATARDTAVHCSPGLASAWSTVVRVAVPQ